MPLETDEAIAARTATLDATTPTPFTITPEEAVIFNRERHAAYRESTAKGDGYAAIQLMGVSRWTAQQAAQFLGLTEASVMAWANAFARSGLSGVRSMSAPTYSVGSGL